MLQTNYNPDVLACLANLSSDEVFTPPELTNQILDLLPVTIWTDPHIKFLDPFCKSGVFLREITKRLSKGLEELIPDQQKRIDHILKNQVFGIATSEITALISRRTLYCSKTANSEFSVTRAFDTEDGNIFFKRAQHEWKSGKCLYCNASEGNPVFHRSNEHENLAYPFLHAEIDQFLADHQFDVIVGGPPYHLQDSEGNVGASPIYPLFVEKVKSLGPRFANLIIPARWFAGGKGLDDFRSQMLNDPHISKLVDYPITGDIFPGLKVIGGICFFLRDLQHVGRCEVETNMNKTSSRSLRLLNEFDTFIRFNEALPIVRKVLKKSRNTLDSKVSQQKPFGLRTNYPGSTVGDLKVYKRNGITTAQSKDIKINEDLIDKWKVITPMGYGEGGETKGYPRHIIGRPIIIEPGSICTETYIVVSSFNTENEASNLAKLLRTKVIRFLIGMRKNTQHVSSDRFKFVPDLDMTKAWDDKALEKYFDITDTEANFISQLISPMDDD